MYDKDKIKRFHINTLNDYGHGLEIADLAQVRYVKETDGSFTQIGLRPIVDEEMFINPGFHESLPGAGAMVSTGEVNLLLTNILELAEKGEIKKINFNEEIKEFPKHIDFMNGVIVMSNKFTVEGFTQLMHRVDYENKYPRLDHMYKIVIIPEKILGNKIILIEKDAILWEKELFKNEATGKDELIDILIKSAEEFGKVDITIRSVNKIKDMWKDRIKVLEVKDSG
jgi:hypothetical protein